MAHMPDAKKEQYRLTTKLPRYKRRIAEAEEAIRKVVASAENPAVSFSHGKDSLVCMEIALKIKPDILVINIDRGFGGDVPEVAEMYQRYANERGINYHRVPATKSVLDLCIEAGSVDKLSGDMMKTNLMEAVEIARKKFNVDCFITGLRAEENKRRSYIRRLGTVHFSKSDNILRCNPVLNWMGEDIWAYIVSNNIPYAAWYDEHAIFHGYEESRYGSWLGVLRANEGRFVALKQFYPEEFKKAVELFPELKQYT